MKATQLTSTATVDDYRGFKKRGDTMALAGLIYDRFFERFVEPFENNPAKHGFSVMAISCLMIEALHSFRKGWKRTGSKGGDAFEEFFASSSHLTDFTGHGTELYTNVRCGLLHQAETYGGWRIRRRGPMLDPKGQAINATKVMNCLKKELRAYRCELEAERSLRSPIWRKALRKLDYIVKNTGANKTGRR